VKLFFHSIELKTNSKIIQLIDSAVLIFVIKWFYQKDFFALILIVFNVPQKPHFQIEK